MINKIFFKLLELNNQNYEKKVIFVILDIFMRIVFRPKHNRKIIYAHNINVCQLYSECLKESQVQEDFTIVHKV